jgi:uncharacterized protein (TIGR02246 family)
MTTPMEVVADISQRYQTAVSANDSAAYGSLFSLDAVRLPPGGKPEHGPEEITKSEQRDYDVATWTIQVRPVHALSIDDDWIYGIAETDIALVSHSDGAKKTMTANKGWLLHRQSSGEWLITRAMWNYQ